MEWARRGRSAATLSVALSLWGARGLAAERAIEGTVVARDGDDLIVDLGQTVGARDGDTVELWRPLRVKHPVTGKVLLDRFRIGALKLAQVRPQLALARAEGKTERTPAAGDVVVLRRSEPDPPRTAGGGPPSSAPVPVFPAEADPDELALTRLFDALRGTPPHERAARYEAFVAARPETRFADVLREEARALRSLVAVAPVRREEPHANFAAPDVAEEGAPLKLAVHLRGDVAGALVHVRRAADVAYTSLPMTRDGRDYFTVTLPGAMMEAPGLVYFIEAALPDGTTQPAVASATAPIPLEVTPPPRAEPPRGLGYSASLWTDYALWNTSPSVTNANDRVFQTEGQFAMRYTDVGVRAVRSGFGVYRGRGGTLDDLDNPQSGHGPRSVGLTYGYLEVEAGLHPSASLIGRVVVGLRDDGVGGGGQAFVRIGSDRRTNLSLGGEVLGGVGIRGIVQLEWRTLPRFPILLRTEVTNEPAGFVAPASVTPTTVSVGTGQVGARAIVQVGYRLNPSLEVALRASYQGRTIQHAGPGAGAAVTYEW